MQNITKWYFNQIKFFDAKIYLFLYLKIKKKDQNLNTLKKRCAQLNREKFNLERTEVRKFLNYLINIVFKVLI